MEKQEGIPCHMNRNAVLRQDQTVHVARYGHMIYKDMDLGQAFGFPVATLQQYLEYQMLDSCILEEVEYGLFQHNELETVVEITGKKANPLISETHSMYFYGFLP